MDIKEFHDLFRFILNRENGGWFSPEEIDVLAGRAEMELFKLMIKGYSITQDFSDALSPFIVPSVNLISDSKGVVGVGSDYQKLLGLWIMGYNTIAKSEIPISVRMLTPAELSEALGSHLNQPDAYHPVAASNGVGSFKIYPETSYKVIISYLRSPKAPLFKYTTDPNNPRTINYDEAGSTHIEFRDQEINSVLVRALQMAGVNISDQMIIQYTTMKEREGN